MGKMYLRSSLAILMLLSFVSVSLAQESEFTHARPGYPTKKIYVLGAVGAAGVWNVEQDTDLLELLTVVRLSGVGTTGRGTRQDAVIHIYRGTEGNRTEIYSGKLQSILVGSKQYPDLLDGDVLSVETRTRIGLLSVATWAGSAASLALLILRIAALSGK